MFQTGYTPPQQCLWYLLTCKRINEGDSKFAQNITNQLQNWKNSKNQAKIIIKEKSYLRLRMMLTIKRLWIEMENWSKWLNRGGCDLLFHPWEYWCWCSIFKARSNNGLYMHREKPNEERVRFVLVLVSEN